MADKEEILDFLRNTQKALEIKTKANGINLWVLLGALALIFWVLVDYINFKDISSKEVIIRTTIFGQNLCILCFFLLNSDQHKNELRYRNFEHSQHPLFDAVVASWFIFPSALFFYYFGNTFGIHGLAFFGLGIAFLAIKGFFRKVVGLKKKNKFPSPNFNPSDRFEEIFPLVIGVMFLAAVIYEAVHIIKTPQLDVVTIKSASLLSAFYVLIFSLLEKHREMRGLEWTYVVEKDLLLGLVSPEVALRRIEHQSLGPKLEEVMNDFFDNLDKKIEELQESISKSSESIEAIKIIPEEYKDERRARSKAALQDSSEKINFLLDEMTDFFAYLERLQKNIVDKRVVSAVENLLGRGKEYFQLIKAYSEQFKELDNFQ